MLDFNHDQGQIEISVGDALRNITHFGGPTSDCCRYFMDMVGHFHCELVDAEGEGRGT